MGEKYQNIHRSGKEANKPRGKHEIRYIHKAYNDYFIYIESVLNMQTVLYPYYFDAFVNFDNTSFQNKTTEEKIVRTIREIEDKEYRLYLLEALELTEKIGNLFDAGKFRALANPNSHDAFEKYLQDFGHHNHDYRFRTEENKP